MRLPLVRLALLLTATVLSGFLLVTPASAQAPPPGGEPLPPRSTPPGSVKKRDPLPSRKTPPADLKRRDPLPPRADPDSIAFPLPSEPAVPSALPGPQGGRPRIADNKNGPAPVAPALTDKSKALVSKLVLGLKNTPVSGLTVPPADVVDVQKSHFLTQREVDALTQALRQDATAREEATRLTRQLRQRGILGDAQAVVGLRDGKVYVYTARTARTATR